MRSGGAFLSAVALFAAAGCTGEPEPSGPLGLEPLEQATSESSLEYTEEQMAADDSRQQIRSVLQKIGQDDKIPENASLEELEALLEEKAEEGLTPKEHAKKLLKVLESADAHNERLERLDAQLFGENAH